MALILASASPRRRELLSLITKDFTVETSRVDEAAITAPTPASWPRPWRTPSAGRWRPGTRRTL